MAKYSGLLTFIASLIFAGSTLAFFGTFDPGVFPSRPDVERVFMSPATYTFLIWTVIYIWLIYATFMQWRKHDTDTLWMAMRNPLIISMIIGAFWPWNFQAGGAVGTVIIIGMLVFAVLSLFRTPEEEPVIGIYPIGLYVGWLCAATGVSLASWLFKMGVASNMVVSSVSLVVAAALAAYVITKKPAAITVTAAAIWALIGVIVQNINGGSTTFAALCFVGILGLGYLGFSKYKEVTTAS